MRLGGLGDSEQRFPAGTDGARPEPRLDPAGEQQPPLQGFGESLQERRTDLRDQRQYLEGPLDLLRFVGQLLEHRSPAPEDRRHRRGQGEEGELNDERFIR